MGVGDVAADMGVEPHEDMTTSAVAHAPAVLVHAVKSLAEVTGGGGRGRGQQWQG